MSRKTQVISQPVFQDLVQQDSIEVIRGVLRKKLQSAATQMVHDLFLEEVEALCGPSFCRKGSQKLYYRGGNDPGSIAHDGQRMVVSKPKVRTRDGKAVKLQSYEALRSYDLLDETVQKHMLNGVTTRNYEPLLDSMTNSLGLKKSTVSKAFVRGSRKQLDELNSSDLSKHDFFCIMIDGVEIGGAMVITALGIDSLGGKHILGIREGDTENNEVCKDLLQKLIDRGLNNDEKAVYLFVLDGSKALEKAVFRVFGDRAFIQRCIRHKERNILAYLPQENHLEFCRRWKALHELDSYSEAILQHKNLAHWLGQKALTAKNSLLEADEKTLTVIKLKAKGELRKTLNSTNPIESAFSIARKQTNRVKSWHRNTDQISRWSAACLLEARKRFKRIKGYRQVPLFQQSMLNEYQKNFLQTTKQAA